MKITDKVAAVAMCLVAFAMSAAAQVTGSGTTGTVPIFTGAGSIGNSPIAATSTNVGIGVSAPAYFLDLLGPSADEPTALKLRGNAVLGLQLRLGDNYSATLRTLYGVAGAVLTSNAYQSTYSADAWTKGVVASASTQVLLGISPSAIATACQVNNSPANTASGPFASFFSSHLLTVLGNGNIGIGVSSPGWPLVVSGTIQKNTTATDGGGILFPEGSRQTTAFPPSNSSTPVNISRTVNANGEMVTISNPANVTTDNGGTLQPVNTEKTDVSSQAYSWVITNYGSNNGHPVNGLQFSAYSQSGTAACNASSPYNPVCFTALTLADSGKVGIGTQNSGASLEVNGNVKLTAGSGASVTFQDGSVQSVSWNGILGGGDYAESFNVTGNQEEYAPGDVLVIDPDSEGNVIKSSEAYSTAVLGIYSTRPGVIGRRQKYDRSHMTEEVPMTMMIGVVPTKVSAEGRPIKPGDLLVTSSKPGYAMKGGDRSMLTGTIIGKSLGHLDSGIRLIEVAVSLQ